MARPKKLVPEYRKHSSGQARVTINGRDFLLGTYGTKASRLEYDRLITEWLASGRSVTFGSHVPSLPLARILTDYIRHAKAYYGNNKRGEYRNVKLAIEACQAYGKLPASELGPVEFKAIRQKLIDAGHSRTYINSMMRRVLRAIKWAASEGKLPASIYETLRLIPGLKQGRCEARETEPVRPVDAATVEATLTHLPATVADMVRVQLLTGCRPGEVCALTPGAIDRKGDVWLAELTEHKTKHHGRQRVIAIGPKAQKILLPYMLRGADEPLFSPVDSERKRRAEISSRRETPANQGNRPGYSERTRKGEAVKQQLRKAYDTVSYARAVKRACEDNGIAHWTPNRLRHTRATEIRSQFGIDAASVVLGHAAPETTRIYAEADIAKAAEVARKIG